MQIHLPFVYGSPANPAALSPPPPSSPTLGTHTNQENVTSSAATERPSEVPLRSEPQAGDASYELTVPSWRLEGEGMLPGTEESRDSSTPPPPSPSVSDIL